ncbi:uncharacterized protein K441DRAFT_735891 [Cenococcum geophilum 1.58]|uniref:uncharacterized protein n=1 Tax=Cenococcum geophilum 1.58 TaxID=794803 RepID=UPI00358FF247|nr:hypothetical protein K441DRAFT_735891 [Cenococcum geophilum 1.58]
MVEARFKMRSIVKVAGRAFHRSQRSSVSRKSVTNMYTRTSFPPALLRKRGRKWREANTRCRTLAFYDTARLRRVRVIASGIALPLMAVVLGSLTTTFTNLASGQVDSLFQRRVNLIYLGIGFTVSSYVSTFCWIVSRENTTCRVRETYMRAILSQNMGFLIQQHQEQSKRASHSI